MTKIKNVDDAIAAYKTQAARLANGEISPKALAQWCHQQAVACFDNRERLRSRDMVAALQSQAAAQYFVEQEEKHKKS